MLAKLQKSLSTEHTLKLKTPNVWDIGIGGLSLLYV